MALKFLPKRLYIWLKSRHLGRGSVDIRYALIEACIIGVFSALAALFIKQGIGWLGGWRIQAAHEYGAAWVLPGVGLTLGLLSGWVVETFSPAAAGGGIPQVKAALARFPMTLSLRVAVVKTIGTILVLGAGLTLGRRAPTVHIGAALAGQLSNWIPTSPEHRRQMIAAGAAAGLAAGFDTPIAGVLFVIEELMRDASGLTLETAIVASLTGSVVSRLLGSADLNFPPNLLDGYQSSFSATEIPFYFVLGVFAGILGGLFNRGMLLSLRVNRQLKLGLPWRIGIAGLISGVIIAFLPPFFRDNSGLREFLVTGGLNWRTTAIAFIAHFFLTMLAYSSGAPGGLFAPALVLGSALGDLVGQGANFFLGTEAASTYAFAGMGAFFTGVVRVPVTAIVIVFEITTDFNLVLPLMIACSVAYIVAESVSRGSLYEHLLEVSGIRLETEQPTQTFLTKLTAAQVMQSQVETLESKLSLDGVLKAMSLSHHRGFPVVEMGKLVGIVTQSDLANLSPSLDKTSLTLQQVMTPQPISVSPDTSLSDVLYLLNHYQLSRLPVTEGNKLVGIITRTDIIRTEANQLSGTPETKSKPVLSYVAYQTRAPAVGKGRVLLPLANPHTASQLWKIAGAIAEGENYELECLRVMPVPKHTIPSEVRVNTRENRKLMQRMERLGRQAKIPVHTQIRLAQDTAEGILETIRERHINVIVMGWKGTTSTQGAIFGDVVDTLIHRAPCTLVLVRLGRGLNAYPRNLNRETTWLIPMAGGPNAKRAIELLPGLTSLYSAPHTPRLWLCKVYPPSKSPPKYANLKRIAQSLRDRLDLPAIPIPTRSASVSEAIIRLANGEHCSAVILGASREGLLQQAIQGNIPEAIAREVEGTVILVRGPIEGKRT